jgi:elongation factor G
VGRGRETSLPRLVAVNRLDRERASLDRTLTSLRESCSRSVIRSSCRSARKDFRGVVDLMSRKAFEFKGDGGRAFTEGAVQSRHDGRGRIAARRRSLKWWPRTTKS